MVDNKHFESRPNVFHEVAICPDGVMKYAGYALWCPPAMPGRGLEVSVVVRPEWVDVFSRDMKAIPVRIHVERNFVFLSDVVVTESQPLHYRLVGRVTGVVVAGLPQ